MRAKLIKPQNQGSRPRIDESIEISSTQSKPSISSLGRALGSRYE